MNFERSPDGSYVGLCLPIKTCAIRVARRPRMRSSHDVLCQTRVSARAVWHQLKFTKSRRFCHLLCLDGKTCCGCECNIA